MLAAAGRADDALAELESVRPLLVVAFGADSTQVRNLDKHIDRLGSLRSTAYPGGMTSWAGNQTTSGSSHELTKSRGTAAAAMDTLHPAEQCHRPRIGPPATPQIDALVPLGLIRGSPCG